MARANKKKPAVPMIVFSRSRDIPFNRIRLSKNNVREIDVEDGLDDLAHDIDRREDIVQGLNVRADLDEHGQETGEFETPAGGRRYRAIARLVEAGRFPPDGLIPCIVKKADAKTSAVDDSLAENLQRLALHPLDQFRAFKRMFDLGMSKEEIAVAYRTTPQYVAQRLRLTEVSPALLDVYAGNGMTLAMLEAFAVSPDHERQEQVWESVRNGWQKEPWQIRSMLTQMKVRAADKRALFIGLDSYEAAGGYVSRDLFQEDGGGWLENPALLDRLVDEKLKTIANEIAGEGWAWVEAAVSFPYGYDHGLRRLGGTFVDLTDEERTAREALRDEHDQLESDYAGAEELPDEIDRRLGEIEQALEAFEQRPANYDPKETAIAGVFVSIRSDGSLSIDRGYVRPADEVTEVPDETGSDTDGDPAEHSVQRTVITIGGEQTAPEDNEDDEVKPLSERLVVELTAYRTVALRSAVAENPHVAMTMLLHKLVSDRFASRMYKGAVEIGVRPVSFFIQDESLSDSPSARAMHERHAAWAVDIPKDDDALWDWLTNLDDTSRMALLTYCVSYGINALYERPNPHSAGGISEYELEMRLSQADRLARATGLDLAEAGFRPTVENYLGRVPKPRILAAVREGAGERAAQLISHLKKGDMALEAQRLLADTGWLPEPLRLSEPADDQAPGDAAEADVAADAALPDFLTEDGEEEALADAEDDERTVIAAE